VERLCPLSRPNHDQKMHALIELERLASTKVLVVRA